MKKLSMLTALALLGATALVACGEDDSSGDDDAPPPVDAAVPVPDAKPGDPDAAPVPMEIEVTADITTDTTWSSPNTYIMKKTIFVKGGTLTIEPGVVVKGLGSAGAPAALVVTRNAKLNAVGTKDAPIVFTSAKDVGKRAAGDWGGVLLLGKAKINDAAGELGVEGFPAGTTEVLYGGQDDTHECGKLKYVRIEFASFVLEANKETNGLTVAACGSKTELDFIQIHKSADDAVEFFGGTANLKHAVLDQGLDDGLDWDFGWTGKVQFLVVQVGNANDSENGFEGDSHPTSFDLTPRSMPTITNVTMVALDNPAGKTKVGALIRRGSGVKLTNAIFFNFNGVPVDVDEFSGQQAPASLFVDNVIYFNNVGQDAAKWNDAEKMGTPDFDEPTFFLDAARKFLTSDPKLSADAKSPTNPSFVVAADSPALVQANAATPPADPFFDATAKFIGAVGPNAADNWLAGWTSFPEN
jgi:hypothetical protein